jgi:hypothetical protein
MAGTEMKNAVLIALVVLVILFVVYQYDPSFFGLFGASEGFADVAKADGAVPSGNAHGNLKAGQMAANGKAEMAQNGGAATVNKGAKAAGMNANKPATMATPYTTEQASKAAPGVQGAAPAKNGEGFADLGAYEGPASFGSAEAPAGCYPRDQLTPSELLPKDMNSIWAEQNPMGPGSLKGKNFLSAGALIGVNTVGQSLRNANLQIRSEPPNPQVAVSIFNQSTISPDISHRPLEIGA